MPARTQLPTATRQALDRSLRKYTEFLGRDAIEEALDTLRKGIDSILNPQPVRRQMADGGSQMVTEGATQTSLRAEMLQLLDRFSAREMADTLKLDFKIETAVNVAHGAGRFVAGQSDVEEYPAWELYRMYERKVPRLWKGDEGTEDATLGGAFASRWYAAAQTANDPDAARVLQDTGRMIALKSSGIWQALGDFEDGLGNPFPPFAFNSGMEIDGVPRNECIELGLLTTTEQPEGTEFDFSKLFSIEEAA